MDYFALKHIHVTFAALSGSLFLLRGLWMFARSAHLQRRWVKTVPHIVDTLLLASAKSWHCSRTSCLVRSP